MTSSALVTVNCLKDGRIAVEKKSNRIKSSTNIREKDTYIDTLEMNENLSIRYDFDTHEN